MRYRCVSNEETVLDLDFSSGIVGGAQIVDIRAPIAERGRHGDKSITSSRRSEIADRKLAAIPGLRIDASTLILDRRRTCSVIEYVSGETRVVIQARQRHLHLNGKEVCEVPKTWFDIELVFSFNTICVYINGQQVEQLRYSPKPNIGIIFTGETGLGTSYHIKAKHGALIEHIGAAREL